MVTTRLCAPRYDTDMVEWIHDWVDHRVVGCRVRRVGTVFIEVHEMAYNLRVVLTNALHPVGEDWFDFLGYGWCYPKELGYQAVCGHVWNWVFDPAHPGRVHPPGPWIKAAHSDVYRAPGIGQRGPDDPGGHRNDF